MSFEPHSDRFNPRWLFPLFEGAGDEPAETPDMFPFFSSEESTNDLTERDFDLALEQIISEKCHVCPLCGASFHEQRNQ